MNWKNDAMTDIFKAFCLAALIFALLAAISACSGYVPETGSSTTARKDGYWLGNSLIYAEVETPRGTVPCIVYDGIDEGGVSCDWSGLD